MPLELVTIPCRQDNYAFLLHDPEGGQTLLVDAPETAPIRAALEARGWRLTDLLITHHHGDHVEGVADLRAGARVIGAAADARRLPPLDLEVAEGDTFTTCGVEARVLDVSGHTRGHIAVHVPTAAAVFTADSLMALGCGRLFEGTPAQMWQSLLKLRALPEDTRVCSGHEYTETNYRFALTVDPDNPALLTRGAAITAARAEGRPTVPSTLAEETATNPFLRADRPDLKAAVGMPEASAVDVFAEVRARRDRFQ
jgi:hydroxyacylglutathione hydrolase